MNPIDIDKADIIDDSHVREAIANAQRTDEAARKRALILTWSKAALFGGVGLGALAFGASFLIQKAQLRVVEVPTVYTDTKVVEVPTVYTDTKVVEVPTVYTDTKVVEKTVEVPAKVAEAPKAVPLGRDQFNPFDKSPVESPKPAGSPGDLGRQADQPPPAAPKAAQLPATYLDHGQHPIDSSPPQKAETPPKPIAAPPVMSDPKVCDGAYCQPKPIETRQWDQLGDKKYLGIITEVEADRVCFNNDANYCTHVVKVERTPTLHAVLDADGKPIIDDTVTFAPMQKWIGYSAYAADRPEDPAHLIDAWVADRGTLFKFVMEPITKT